jgi:nucleoside-diphosphate-sugar epimerase
MKVVLTGATGFVGKPCLELLLQRGHEVLVISRQDQSSIAKRGVHWCRGDLGVPETYGGALAKFQPEAALHLAWEGIPDFSLQKCMANLHAGVVFGNAALEAGCRHLVVAGSCWEYGKVAGMVVEDAPAASPGIFGASKNAQHSVLRALFEGAGASVAWSRIFFVFGPAQRAASLVPVICRSIAAGESPSLRTPAAVSDFLYVDDAAAALVTLLETNVSGVFNVGSGTGTRADEVAGLLLRIAGKEDVFAARRSADGPGSGFYADLSRMRALGWSPRVGLEEGLRRTLDGITHGAGA